MRPLVPLYILQAPPPDDDPSSTAAGDTATTPSHAAAAATTVTMGTMGRFELDLSFGGPGCAAEGGWEAGEWRRVPRAAHVNGKAYLPNWGRNITTVAVRWAYLEC